MTELEAKVRCLELAATLSRPSGDYSADAVVNIAMVLYTFTQAPVAEETKPVIADKPSKGSKAKVPDIMS